MNTSKYNRYFMLVEMLFPFSKLGLCEELVTVKACPCGLGGYLLLHFVSSSGY